MKRDWRETFGERVAPRLASSGLRGTVKVVVEGEAQPYYLTLGGAPSVGTVAPAKLDGIVRASGPDLEALLAGRMSLSDGLITERIGVSGDLQLVMGLSRVLAEGGA
jgi:hypothetical protein